MRVVETLSPGVARLTPGQQLVTQDGHLVVVRQWHAEGSYSRIYQGVLDRRDESTECAIKLARLEDDRSLVSLQRELGVLQLVRHPHLVALLDWGATPPGPPTYAPSHTQHSTLTAHQPNYLVLQWIPGESLDAYVTRVRRMPLAHALRALISVAAAAAALHSAGFAHGDLRSANVRVSLPGPVVVLTDLGSAVGRNSPQFGDACRSDVDRLGDLLHLMLTGASLELGRSRLSSADGHHPEAVGLYNTIRTTKTSAAQVEKLSTALLSRLNPPSGP